MIPAVARVSHRVHLYPRAQQGKRRNTGILLSLPEPATEHDSTGISSLTSVDDGRIFLVRACGLRTGSSPISGVGLSGLVTHPKSVVLGGLPFVSSDIRDFCAHGQYIIIDNPSAPSGRFIARVSAAVTIDDCRPGRREFCCRRHCFRFGFCRTLWGRHGLGRNPRCRDEYRPACSFPVEHLTASRLRRDHSFGHVRPFTAW